MTSVCGVCPDEEGPRRLGNLCGKCRFRFLKVMPSDVRTLVDGFAKNPLKTRREGLYFKEKDYKCVRADDYSLYAKSENTGVVVVKTRLYLLVATYTEGMYPSVCVEATEKLGEYLRRKGN
ncbi:profilin-4 isoform X2 [Orcinus orca]|uniref:profilin-4 isoform X2 n=1 Tax=Orcinus orca TaxID=9733 RepID=UPI00211121D9|nr:profilin-4 isoform X2 [Orcinus orca]